MAAGLTGALALTACGGGGDGAKDGPTPSASPTATAGSGAATGAAPGASGKLQGSWITTAGGKIVALVVNGDQAGLFATGGSVCSGTAGTEAGMQMIHLTCTDGSKDRVSGMVDSVGAKTMKVTWSGKLGQETFTRAEGGRLPSGLPTGLKQ
ncbi:hypothetical protein [Streptomyces sp. NK08204]|uniref:hypothetical protein n=1 Tax=Streptomyces sp. NK08204 TaxID=2873260 RepID=UPI001CEDFDA8|nr:hypothetical protein [Streptomyces sp. NK08204]